MSPRRPHNKHVVPARIAEATSLFFSLEFRSAEITHLTCRCVPVFKVACLLARAAFASCTMPLVDVHHAWVLGGATTVLSVVLSMMLISKHLNNMVNPRQQRFIINIITMVGGFVAFARMFPRWLDMRPRVLCLCDGFAGPVVCCGFIHWPARYSRVGDVRDGTGQSEGGVSCVCCQVAHRRGLPCAEQSC